MTNLDKDCLWGLHIICHHCSQIKSIRVIMQGSLARLIFAIVAVQMSACVPKQSQNIRPAECAIYFNGTYSENFSFVGNSTSRRDRDYNLTVIGGEDCQLRILAVGGGGGGFHSGGSGCGYLQECSDGIVEYFS